MSFAEALNHAGAKPAGKRPYFLDSQVERVLAITMAVAQELAVTRQRADTLERLLLDKGILSAGEIDAFAPDRAASAERQMWNQEYIARILRIVQQENEAAMFGEDVASGDVGDELAGEK
ncbi:hypothetical protein [Novosphingobium sp. P6W]|jgi:hypothetical protein|uniref:hypothetical protein n=1 Tax=Novosphingobium sp. P6W TaxID=1609758 RepID=UPI0005C2A973|nr:hypothetical protein [Novosphingobium sp. P6W]AXB79448.1 hypothetical protein TQ38_023535 [Novosphingobium sp. P6W]KIS34211.1 hypothetical protein TQ38_00675 [Novosphingobium sp. P6W]